MKLAVISANSVLAVYRLLRMGSIQQQQHPPWQILWMYPSQKPLAIVTLTQVAQTDNRLRFAGPTDLVVGQVPIKEEIARLDEDTDQIGNGRGPPF